MGEDLEEGPMNVAESRYASPVRGGDEVMVPDSPVREEDEAMVADVGPVE